MDELLRKRSFDLMVVDMLEVAYRIERVKKITLDFPEFCRIIGKDVGTVRKLFKHRLLPENLIIGGYDNRKQKEKILFDTEKVLEWLRQQKETIHSASIR